MSQKEFPSAISFLEAEGPREPQTFINLSRKDLVEHAVTLGQGFQIEVPDNEGNLVKGALSIETKKNARSAKDKHFVKTENTDGRIWEDINRPQSPEGYGNLKTDVTSHFSGQDTYVQYVALGAPDDPDATYRTRQIFKFVTNSPAHALFATNVYRDLTPEELAQTENEDFRPDVTIYHAPDFKTDPERHDTRSDVAISFNYDDGEIIIAGTDYLGEIKKSGFTWMHYMAEEQSSESVTVAVVHGSAIQNEEGKAVAVVGNSGAGKSSALPNPTDEEQARGKMKVADDELLLIHDRVNGRKKTVNIEGGVYISVLNLNAAVEPEFAAAIMNPTSLLENVKMYEGTKIPNFADPSITPNMRAALNGASLPNYKESGVTGELSDYINLYADMRGIFPAVVKARNKYHAAVLSMAGVATNIPGRVAGDNEIREGFIPWCDEPFLPFPPVESIDNFLQVIGDNNSNVWVNSSGVVGGPYGVGERMPIPETQAGVAAVVDGSLAAEIDALSEEERKELEDPIFKWLVPPRYQGQNVWEDQEAYERNRDEYAVKFVIDFVKRYPINSHPEMPKMYAELPNVGAGIIFANVKLKLL